MKPSSAEFRLLATFAAGIAVLALCAWFGLGSGADYLDASHRAERLADAARDIAGARAALARAELDALQGAGAPAAATEVRAELARAAADLEGDAANRVAGLQQGIGRQLDALAPGGSLAPAALAPLVESEKDLRALEDWIGAQKRQARETARGHGDRARDAAWMLALVVIMLLSGAYAFIMGGMRERRRLLGRLRQSVNHDPLTGLPNRRFFGEWLGYAIAHARREVRHVGLLFVDIEGVKAVDELHGKADADALLIEIARRFRETAREGDLLARIGPFEFALAIPDITDPHEATPLAQRLRDALTDPTLPPLADTPIGASVGVAFYPDDADDPAGVMAAADAAMFAAKGAGRNRVAFKALSEAA